ncbi:YbaB/EbfC family DNA-binding protein [Gordonia shandongensis]|uniref:YbaB/EbfC family DNA-binding protein n=1 Tax=Gordonia shandongensis TaxID=376351 RepID=UPI0003F85DB6|nr:YbaB/EbfC family DNA-binding protein [Gordonia shandongensis]
MTVDRFGTGNAAMDALQDRARDQLGALEDVGRRLSSLRAVGVGDDGRVRVEVDGHGAMIDLTILDGAGGGRAARLAEAIVGAAIRAATEVFAVRGEIMREFCEEFADLTGTDLTGTDPTGESLEPNRGPVRPTS